MKKTKKTDINNNTEKTFFSTNTKPKAKKCVLSSCLITENRYSQNASMAIKAVDGR